MIEQSVSEVLGFRISMAEKQRLISLVQESVACDLGNAFLYVNAHTLDRATKSRVLGGLLRDADVLYCDGFGVRLVARIVGSPVPPRLTPPDWIDDLFDVLPDGSRLSFIGDEPGVAEQALKLAISNHSHLIPAGAMDGFQSLDAQGYADAIHGMVPDLVLVGMGTPHQEEVVIGTRTHGGPTLLSVGALFRYYASFETRAPRLVTDHGLEWLARWAAHPVSLSRRYGIGLPSLFVTALRERSQP